MWFCGHNPGNTFGATLNTGVLYLRPTQKAIDFTARWHAKLEEKTDDWHMEVNFIPYGVGCEAPRLSAKPAAEPAAKPAAKPDRLVGWLS